MADTDRGKLRLGCHLSISKGLDRAADFAVSLGANTFQYFTRNPRGGAARQIGAEEIARWQAARRERDIFPIVGHLPYTVNLCAGPGRLQEFAHMVVRDDLARVAALGGETLVSHPGHHEGDRAEALGRLVELLRAELEQAGPGPDFCLETMALQNREIGSLDDMGEIVRRLDRHPRLGVWLDSAHLFAAGWDLREQAQCDRLVEELERQVGLERVKGMHLNDSLAPVGSHRDRHAGIGLGELGEQGIKNIVRHPWLGRLPLILETPVEKYEDYAPEIALLAGWYSG